MKTSLSSDALAQLFTEARTFNRFTDAPVSDALLQQLYDLYKWGPTAMNSQPARVVFLKSEAAKARLKSSLSAGNMEKTLAAPVAVIVAHDTHFQDNLPTQFPAYDAKPMFDGNAALAESTAFRGSSLQGAYLILAARSLGLDCGPMSGFNNAALDAEFFPDGRFKSNFLINLGYGDAAGNRPRGPRLDFATAASIL
jgi:3-hydroxypropanoate dehydrogenase